MYQSGIWVRQYLEDINKKTEIIVSISWLFPFFALATQISGFLAGIPNGSAAIRQKTVRTACLSGRFKNGSF